MGKWKAFRPGPNAELELYDMEKDTGETENIASSHPDVVKKIKEILKNVRVESDIWPMRG